MAIALSGDSGLPSLFVSITIVSAAMITAEVVRPFAAFCCLLCQPFNIILKGFFRPLPSSTAEGLYPKFRPICLNSSALLGDSEARIIILFLLRLLKFIYGYLKIRRGKIADKKRKPPCNNNKLKGVPSDIVNSSDAIE